MNPLRTISSLFGYDVIRKSKDVLLPRHLSNLLSTYQTNLIIDVGANVGQYGKLLRNIGYRGIIHSFEPTREAFASLEENASTDKLWFTHNFALGSENKTQEINITQNSDLSSFLNPNHYCKEKFNHKQEIVSNQVVNIKRLDDIFDELKAPINDISVHLKMDTQGYDIEVFKGCTSTLKHIATLQSEISIIPIYDGMPNYLESLSAYNDAGYSISGLFPVTRDKSSLSVIEFDCVMVKSKK